jgi:hypothetical protein
MGERRLKGRGSKPKLNSLKKAGLPQTQKLVQGMDLKNKTLILVGKSQRN